VSASWPCKPLNIKGLLFIMLVLLSGFPHSFHI
jgi:hypothetical protein